MPRDASDRPVRRLTAILDHARKLNVRRFKATKLDGVGEGLEFVFGPAPLEEPPEVRDPPRRLDLDSDRPQPIDELDLVAEGREGPIPS